MKQPTAIYTSHVIATYVLEANMPTKLGIYAKYLRDLYARCIHIHVLHMKSMKLNM